MRKQRLNDPDLAPASLTCGATTGLADRMARELGMPVFDLPVSSPPSTPEMRQDAEDHHGGRRRVRRAHEVAPGARVRHGRVARVWRGSRASA
jgi:hypothetical protein